MRMPQEDRRPASPFAQQRRQIFRCVCVRNIGCIKPNFASRLGFEKLSDVSSEDGANQDVGVQDNHLSEGQPSHGDAPS